MMNTKKVKLNAQQKKLLKSAKAAAGILKDANIPGWETAESTSKWVRQLRKEADGSMLEAWKERI